jgi:hypothetical protein
MYKDNMNGLSVTNYFALVSTPGIDVVVKPLLKFNEFA